MIYLSDLILKLIPWYNVLIHCMPLVHQCNDGHNLIIVNHMSEVAYEARMNVACINAKHRECQNFYFRYRSTAPCKTDHCTIAQRSIINYYRITIGCKILHNTTAVNTTKSIFVSKPQMVKLTIWNRSISTFDRLSIGTIGNGRISTITT